MVIRKLGHASFRIKGAKTSVVTDPFNSKMVGIPFPRTTADIVTVSHQHDDHNKVDAVGGEPFVVSGPGEYEIKGVRIRGIRTYHDNKQGAERGDNLVYIMYIDEIAVMHCGDLGHQLSEESLELVNSIDILFVPVGGVYTIDAETAAKVVAQLEPRIVIPMHYNEKSINQQIFGKLSSPEAFLKEVGEDELEPIEKLVITKAQLPEETKFVLLS